MGKQRITLRKCEDCGKEFYGIRRRILCDDCRAERERERARRYKERARAEGRLKNNYNYTCKFCGARTSNTKEICTSCKQKWELCGIIVEMLRREKKKYGYTDKA